MFKFTIKSLLGHKLRLALTALSISLGVAFISGTFALTDSIRSEFNSVFDEVFAGIDVVVRPDWNSDQSLDGIPEALLEDLRGVEGVESIEGNVEGEAVIVYEDGSLSVSAQGPPSLGFAWGNVGALNPLSILDGNGRSPQEDNEATLDLSTAKEQSIGLGDMINVQAGEQPLSQYEVVGLTSFGSEDSLAGATIMTFTLERARSLFDYPGSYSSISIAAVDGFTPDQLRSNVAAALPNGAEAVLGTQQQAEEFDELNSGLAFFNVALLAFAGVSVFVASFLIQNTFQIIVAQRSRELAMLRALGMTRPQIIRMVLFEALIVALIATLIGIAMGLGLAWIAREAIIQLGVEVPKGGFSLSPVAWLASLAVGLGVTTLASLLPAFKASRVAPVEAMRDAAIASPRRSLKMRLAIGVVILGAGAGLLSIGLFASIPDPIYSVAAGVIIMFFGVAILAPILTAPVFTVMGLPVRWVGGIMGHISAENAKNSPRRTAATAAALMIGVALVGFTTIFASSVKATIDDAFKSIFPGDISVSSRLFQDPSDLDQTIPRPVNNIIDGLDAIGVTSGVRYDSSVAIDGGDPELVVGVEPSTFSSAFRIKPSPAEYTTLDTGTVYVRELKLNEKGLSVGDSIDVEFDGLAAQTFTISGSFEDAFDSPYIFNVEDFETNLDVTEDLLLVANVSPGFTIDEGAKAINDAIAGYPLIQAQSSNDLVEDFREQIDNALALLFGLLGFSIIIAVIGITNTLALSVSERTREIGMLRAIGMTRRQVRKMVRFESVMIAVFGALLGIGMGIFFSWAILQALKDLGFTAFSVPWLQLALYLVVAVIAGVIAAAFPAFKASRMNAMAAIKTE